MANMSDKVAMAISKVAKVKANPNDVAHGKNAIDLYFELSTKDIKDLEKLNFHVQTTDVEELQDSGHSFDGVYHILSWNE